VLSNAPADAEPEMIADHREDGLEELELVEVLLEELAPFRRRRAEQREADPAGDDGDHQPAAAWSGPRPDSRSGHHHERDHRNQEDGEARAGSRADVDADHHREADRENPRRRLRFPCQKEAEPAEDAELEVSGEVVGVEKRPPHATASPRTSA